MPGRAYLPADTFDRASALASDQTASNDIWSLGFTHRADSDIAGLADYANPQPMPDDTSPSPQLQPLPASAPVIVSPRPDAMTIQQQQQSQQPAPVALPSIGDSGAASAAPGNSTSLAAAPGPAPSAAPGASGVPTAMPSGDSGDLESYARSEAQRLGIDPDTAARVANTEGGFSDPTRQNTGGAPAYGPYQAYIGGPSNPGLGDEMLAQGIDPRNPADARRAITYSLEHAAQNGWGAFQGAAANGIGQWDGIGQAPAQPTEIKQNLAKSSENTPSPSQPSSGWEVDQAALDDPDKWSLCGPVAAVMAAGRRGAAWTVAQAKQIATASGLWDSGNGMHGLGTEVDLLNRMGVSARLGDANAQQLAADAQAGNTPIISTNRHYFILKGYDPATGKFDTTTSGSVLKGGSRYLSLDEIATLGGGIQGAAYMDNPSSPTPSVAAPPTAGVTPAPAGSPSASAAAAPPAADAPDPLRQQLDQLGNAGPASLKARSDQPQDDPGQEPTGIDYSGRKPLPEYQRNPNGPIMTGAPFTTINGDVPFLGTNRNRAVYGPSIQEGPEPVQPPAPPPLPPPPPEPNRAVQGEPVYDGPVDVRGFPAGSGGWPMQMYRQPLASTMGPSLRDANIGSADVTTSGTDQQPYDPDQGPHEATPGSVGAGPVGPLYGLPDTPANDVPPAPTSPQAPFGFPGLQAVYDQAGNFLHWIQGAAQGVQNQVDSQMAGPVQSTPGEPDYVPPSNPVQRWIDTPIAQAPDQAPPSDPALAAGRLYMPPYPQSLVPRDVGADMQRFGPRTLEAVREAAQAVQQSSTDTQQAISQGDLIGTIWNGAKTAIDALNVPFTGVTSSIDNALPSYDVKGIGFGTALGDAQVAVDVGHALAVGIKITPKVVAALRAGVPVDRLIELAGRGLNAAADTIDRGIGAAGSALDANAARVAAGDARSAGTVLPGTLGAVPSAAAQTAETAAPPFFSQLQRTITDKMPNRAAPSQVQSIIRGNGVKPDEVAWTGLDDWLREQSGPVTKQQVLDFLDQNAVKVDEVVRGNLPSQDALQAHPDVQAAHQRVLDATDAVAQAREQGDLTGDYQPMRQAMQQAAQARQDADGVVRRANQDMMDQSGITGQSRYGTYTLPGGENYRELLLTLPPKNDAGKLAIVRDGDYWGIQNQATGEWQMRGETRGVAENYLQGLQRKADGAAGVYSSSHWEEPNVLAHVRFNDRVAPDGAKVLNIEEVQSDWHQAGRKEGYQQKPHTPEEWDALTQQVQDARARFGDDSPEVRAIQDQATRWNADDNSRMGSAVPNAPFAKTWPELAVKRMIRWAAENGYDRITWPPGQVHADRYSLAQHVDELFYTSKDGATGTLIGRKGAADVVEHENVPANKLGEYVGQDVANRLLSSEPETTAQGDRYYMAGRDLATMGGEGMKGFYDQILPAVAQKLGKKFGARVRTSEIAIPAAMPKYGGFTEPRTQAVHSMDITPAMKQSVMEQGQPLFVTPGVLPSSMRGAGALNAVTQEAGRVAAGGVGGATIGAGLPADTPEERRRNALLGAGVGMVAGPLASRLATRGAGGALASLGAIPERDSVQAAIRAAAARGDTAEVARLRSALPEGRNVALPGMEPPPSRAAPNGPAQAVGDAAAQAEMRAGGSALPGMEAQAADRFAPVNLPPAVQRMIDAGVNRAEAMAQQRGVSALDWFKALGYSGIYGPVTGMVNTGGAATVLGLSVPKEFIRAAARGQPAEYAPQALGAFRAIPEMFAGALHAVLAQGPLSSRLQNPIGKGAAYAIERPGALFAAAPDAMMRPLFESQGMYREAAQLATQQGAKGIGWWQAVEDAVSQAKAYRDGQIVGNPYVAQQVAEGGQKYADRSLFQGPIGGIGKKVRDLANQDGLAGVMGNLLLPFTGTPYHMAMRTIENVPGSAAVSRFRGQQPTRFDAVYDQMFGATLAGGLIYVASQGRLTGPGPDDPEKRAEMVSQGWSPNALAIGGQADPNDPNIIHGAVYIPTRLFAHFQPILDTAGTIHDALAYQKKDAKPGPLTGTLVSRIAAQLGGPEAEQAVSKLNGDFTGQIIKGTIGPRGTISNMVWLQGLTDIISQTDAQDPTSGLPNYLARTALRYVPYAGVARAVATAEDPYPRRTSPLSAVGFGEATRQAAAQSVPSALAPISPIGTRQGLRPSLDVLGRPAENPQQGLAALGPKMTTGAPDPVINAFENAGVDISQPRTQIGIGPAQVDLTPEEQDRFKILRGEQLIRLVGPRAENGSLDRMKPEVRQQVLTTLLAAANNVADAKLAAELPNRAQRIRDALQADRAKKAS